jgi:hypothetical protein
MICIIPMEEIEKFAVWNTVESKFLEIQDIQAWSSADELAKDIKEVIGNRYHKEFVDSIVERARVAGY